MNKHQQNTYETLGIVVGTGLTNDDVRQIINSMASHINWENDTLAASLLGLNREYPSGRHIARFLKQLFGGSGPITSPQYWLARGHNNARALVESSAAQIKRTRPTQIAYWLAKGMDAIEATKRVSAEQSARSNKAYAARDAEYRKRKTTRSVLYWTSRGYNAQETEEHTQSIYKHHSAALTGRTDWLPNDRRNTRVNYYLKLGMSEDEARAALRQRQTTRVPITPENRQAFHKYRVSCWYHTRLNQHAVTNIEMRSSQFHLDHIYSIYDGFHTEIPPEVIGSTVNLRIISSAENLSKQRHSHHTKEDLIREYDNLGN